MSPTSRLLRYVDRYRREFLVGLACAALSTSIALASPMVLRYAIDDLTHNVTRAKLLEYGSLLLAIGLLGGLFRFLMRRILMGASRQIEYDMRNDFFAHLERLPTSYFQAHRTGDLMSRATNDLSAVRMMIGPSVMYSANTLLTLALALAMMVSIDRRLTLIALIPLPFVSVSVKMFGSAIHRRFEEIQAQLSEVSAVVQESLSGVRVVRAYRQEHAELDRFRRSNEEYLARNRRLIVLQGFFFPTMSFFMGLGVLLVLWLGSQDVIRGRITLGQFVAFNVYLTLLAWPMIAFGWVTNMVQRGMASWKRMLEVLDVEPSREQLQVLRQATAGDVHLKVDATSAAGTLAAGASAGGASAGGTLAASASAAGTLAGGALADGMSAAGTLAGGASADGMSAAGTLAAGASAVGTSAGGALAGRTSEGRASTVAPADRSDAISTTGIRGEIELRDVVFGYGGPPVIDHVSAHIEAGQTVALVGATGSGKSTLISLLARIHEPPRGTVLVDGVDVRDIPLEVLRRAIGVVPQEPFLFSDTLEANVAFGLDARRAADAGTAPGLSADADRHARVVQAAAVARLDKDVADFPGGYDTLVGERGITLSGGQKQRAALARAIAVDPRILILDDALSAVDTYTEEEILTRLRGVMRTRTAIIVSHRISTVRHADRIFVLDRGRIVEQGSHESLVARGGLYAALHRKQLLEEELAAS